jgi:hypothetical protein
MNVIVPAQAQRGGRSAQVSPSQGAFGVLLVWRMGFA